MQKSDVSSAQAHLVIRYPVKRGFILEAHTLQQLVGEYFDLSVSAEELAGDCFSLELSGETIYAEAIAESSQIPHHQLLELISTYLDPLKKIPAATSKPVALDGDQDPEHRRWLNSVCSGE